MRGFVLTAGLFIGIVCGIGFADAASPVASSDTETLRGIIQSMKDSPRGPFQRIRWFCKDGTVHPARPYPCGERGGGVQHGEWSAQTRRLRSQGYYIANVLADIRPKRFIRDRQHPEMLRQMILEQFLISADDGWIFRQARYYRGSLQAEDEEKAGRELLKELIRQWIWRGQRLPILREAARFLPHGQPEPNVVRMRQLSRNIAEQDRRFEALRVKLHVRPEVGDARKVREYADRQGLPRLTRDYKTLAALLDDIYRAGNTAAEIRALAKLVKNRTLARMLRQKADKLSGTSEPEQRLWIIASLLRVLRRDFYLAGSSRRMLAVLDTSLSLEREFFQLGNQVTAGLSRLTRRERLEWLKTTSDALYGVYLISDRQWHSLRDTLHRLIQTRPVLNTYKSELDYLARVPGWADRFHSFYFSRSVTRLTTVEPLASRYIHDRLHGSPLLFYSEVLDSLMADADQLIGVSHMMFSHQISGGLRGLNPGLARGILRFVTPGKAVKLERDGIYVLPVTTENLPPVAGIITAGQGNALSHIQLLARNLGIPNVAVDQRLLPRLQSEAGQAVVLAVSPRGVVHLSRDSARWDPVFRRSRQTDAGFMVRPDMEKLDLRTKNFISLRELRATDSGRICGPKAANLGELKAHFPKAVTEGVVIPFGAYRTLLDQPFRPGGPSAFDWMRDQYAAIRAIKDQQEREATESRFLEQMCNWITRADPGRDFRRRLRSAMNKTFGRSGSYGVFVRSDTNVEDLPGFTGAGLNLTVPHVVGFKKTLEAISRVWASPFAERAYRWRQGHMASPEHVYCSVLLMKSVPAEKSGVMVTADLVSGDTGQVYVAVSEGVGGAVAGQTAEELRIDLKSAQIRLMAQAAEPLKRVLVRRGGVRKDPASGADSVLKPEEIAQLIELAKTVPERFPALRDDRGVPVPADIEFGFYKGRLALFQIRPFLESKRALQNLFLHSLDRTLSTVRSEVVDLDKAAM